VNEQLQAEIDNLEAVKAELQSYIDMINAGIANLQEQMNG